jgi:hypothetical protein
MDPQHCYKVGDYDSDEGELWADEGGEEDGEDGEEGGSEASWTTESETEVEVDETAVFHSDEEDKKGKRHDIGENWRTGNKGTLT